MALVVCLYLSLPRKARPEDFADAKFMYYAEEKGRIKVTAPSFMYQHETPDGWTIKLDGIYNSISGATPTGAPMAPTYKTVYTTVSRPEAASEGAVSAPPRDDDGDEDEDEESDDLFENNLVAPITRLPSRLFSAISGATPASGGGTSSGGGTTGSSSSSTTTRSTTVPTGKEELPMADFSDDRLGLNLGVSRKIGRHTPGTMLSFSRESDYTSTGISLQDAIDFNKRATTLVVGGGYIHDVLSPANGLPEDTKNTIDLLLGISQIVTPTTRLTANVTIGQVSGFISDPYKVVSLNGSLVPEKRPDTKDKQVAFLSVNQFVAPLKGSAELSLRHYSDSFGITAETLTLTWLQKVGEQFIVSPLLRYYEQTEADFYDVTFTGSPEFYSADYRISAFQATSYGLQLIWMPAPRWAFDVAYERYAQEGTDGKTPQEAYVSANIVRAGVRLNF